jgi:hypothetical protein
MQTFQRHALALAASATAAVLGAGRASAQTPSRPRAASQAACQVEGVWEQVFLAFDDREMGLGSRPARKIVARGHWIWIGADARRDTLPLRTAADSLRATRIFGGAGTYTTTDSTFTQHIDYFFDPGAEGATLVASCRTEGERWYYAFTTAGVPGMGGWPRRVSEVWRRLR